MATKTSTKKTSSSTIKKLAPTASSSEVKAIKAIVSSSGSARADRGAIDTDIRTYEKGFNSKALERAAEAERATIEAERRALDARRDAEVEGIENSFEDLRLGTEDDQGKEFAGRATQLITSGGGFLGATQSQQGVLQDLRERQRLEVSGLETKKQAAIRQARNAYDDRDFTLARDLVKSARDFEKEIYNRQQSYADRQINLARYDKEEKNAQRKELSGLASKYISAGINLDSDDFDSAMDKIRKSKEYLLDQERAELDMANTRSLIAERNSPTKDDILTTVDLQRISELYDVTLPFGTTQLKAAEILARENTPEAKLRTLITSLKASNNDYKTVVAEIDNDDSIEDKALAKKIAADVYKVASTAPKQTELTAYNPNSRQMGQFEQQVQTDGFLRAVGNFLFNK